jgi:AraC-like DNA-binding protein
MHANPESLSERPASEDAGIDVMGDVLDAVHLTTAVFGRLELGSPWRLRIPERDYLSFYVIARGSAWLEIGAPGTPDHLALPLSAGDAVVMPRGSAHSLRDADHSPATPVDFDYDHCPRAWTGSAVRFGGTGPVTTLVTGQFTFGTSTRNVLLESLPPAIHLPAHAAAASPQLGGVVPLILAESAGPSPGHRIVLARLADLLLVHALRYWVSTSGAASCGLRAVADPAIGMALRLMHARPAEAWTVDRLATAVSMSRSSFAARFTELVGEPPLQYLARWRMSRAARLLQDGQMSVAAVAEQVGYANAVAFTKAFSRLQGVGPGTFRRQAVRG